MVTDSYIDYQTKDYLVESSFKKSLLRKRPEAGQWLVDGPCRPQRGADGSPEKLAHKIHWHVLGTIQLL